VGLFYNSLGSPPTDEGKGSGGNPEELDRKGEGGSPISSKNKKVDHPFTLDMRKKGSLGFWKGKSASSRLRGREGGKGPPLAGRGRHFFEEILPERGERSHLCGERGREEGRCGLCKHLGWGSVVTRGGD